MIRNYENSPVNGAVLSIERPQAADKKLRNREDFPMALFDIIDESLSELYGHDMMYYLRKDRHRDIVDVRHKILYLYRHISRAPLWRMEDLFKINHSTMLHSFACTENLRTFDEEFARDYETLHSKINEKLEKL